MLHLFTRVYLHVRIRTRAPIDRRYLFVSREREREREREAGQLSSIVRISKASGRWVFTSG